MIHSDNDVALFEVASIATDSNKTIARIIAFHSDGADHGGKNFSGHFIDPAIMPGFTAGDGSGTPYSA